VRQLLKKPCFPYIFPFVLFLLLTELSGCIPVHGVTNLGLGIYVVKLKAGCFGNIEN